MARHPDRQAQSACTASSRGRANPASISASASSYDFEGPPIVVFDYQTGRAGAHARAFLSDWKGQLMVDDYSGYKAMFVNDVSELACLAHVRRKFFELHAANRSPIAAEALRRIGLLYAVEQQACAMNASQRWQLRQEQAKPVLIECKHPVKSSLS